MTQWSAEQRAGSSKCQICWWRQTKLREELKRSHVVMLSWVSSFLLCVGSPVQALHVLPRLHGFSQRSPPSAYSPKNMHPRQIGLCGETRVPTNSRMQKKKRLFVWDPTESVLTVQRQTYQRLATGGGVRKGDKDKERKWEESGDQGKGWEWDTGKKKKKKNGTEKAGKQGQQEKLGSTTLSK